MSEALDRLFETRGGVDIAADPEWRALIDQICDELGIDAEELLRRMQIVIPKVRGWVSDEIAKHGDQISAEKTRWVIRQRWIQYMMTGGN